jgi:hypothetical protein
LTNTNGNSAFSLGGPPTLLAPNGQVSLLQNSLFFFTDEKAK